MKHTPLNRGEGPIRKTPLKATQGIQTARSLKRGEKRATVRSTGPDVGIRRMVMDRAGQHCERCGKVISGEYSIHHRKPRGMGGTKDPAINSAANLVLLCGSATSASGCHQSVERFRQAASATGFLVLRTADPATVPIKLHSGWVLLGHDGKVKEIDRPEMEEHS